MQYRHKTCATSPGPGPIVYIYIYIYHIYIYELIGSNLRADRTTG